MFSELQKINTRPEPFSVYTTKELWTGEHTSKQMLSYHLNDEIDASSRNSAFIDRSVEWIASHFNIGTGMNVIDFGCGPGLYTTRLAQSGANVTGVDFSKRSIEYAKETAGQKELTIRYINQNYLEFEPDEHFHLATMIMCDFCALSPSQRKTMLKVFFNALIPGGHVLLDGYSLTAFRQREEAAVYAFNQLNGFWSPNPYYGFVNTYKYETEKVVLDQYTIIEADRTWTVYNWLQYFTLDALKSEFESCGFEIAEYHTDVAGTPFDPESAEFAVVAKKPE